MKQVIYDCQCSQSHFYKVLAGERPLNETISKSLAKLLNISEKEVEQLINSELETEKERPIQTSSNIRVDTKLGKRIFLLLTALLICSTISYATYKFSLPVEIHQNQIADLILDSSTFIKDVTIPDGTAVPVNTVFLKTWRIKNTGQIIWSDRYLQRTTITAKELCQSPQKIPIPQTAPGEIIDLSVTFKTPALPGSCRTDWKMVDKKGNLIYPEISGLYSIIQVVKTTTK
ncbi:NBR1-Ig-like domain-containing protein [Pseudoalteromonas caenipelagi]|uniref:NBR1-Ig-like domain-containing protein n=1 Tax=Pseudoalteromonas caenipelagi TaxID=2726988 RepID=UPI001FE9C305|nr:NBR1-Ig-like domain-containing protein [Pseudoalteromonas caenipelagi]